MVFPGIDFKVAYGHRLVLLPMLLGMMCAMLVDGLKLSSQRQEINRWIHSRVASLTASQGAFKQVVVY